MRPAHASLLLAALAIAGTPATAAEFSLTGNVAQRLSAISNPDADPESEGLAVGSITSIGLDLSAQKGRTRAAFSTGASFSAFAGPAADDDLNLASPNASGRVRYTGRRFGAGTNFSFSRTSTTFSELNTDAILRAIDEQEEGEPIVIPADELIVEEDAIRTSFGLGADLDYTLTPRNRLTLAASGRITRFSEDVAGLEPSSNYGANLSWTHSLSARSSAGLSLGARRFTANDAEETEGLTLSFSGDYRTALSPRTELNASAGASFTEIDELDVVGGVGVPTTDRDVSFSGSLGATYRSDRDTIFNFSVRQAVVPTTDGELQNVTGLRANYRQNLTPLVRLTVGAGHSISSDLGEASGDLEQFFTLSPSISYQFAPRWSASLGYGLRVEDDESGIGVSNRVFLSVSRSLELF